MNTSAIFAKLPNEIKGVIIHHLTNNSSNYNILIYDFEEVFNIFPDEIYDIHTFLPSNVRWLERAINPVLAITCL